MCEIQSEQTVWAHDGIIWLSKHETITTLRCTRWMEVVVPCSSSFIYICAEKQALIHYK